MAKGIEKFLLKISVQSATYWAPGAEDGYGQKSFAAGVDIPVRWDARERESQDRFGKTVFSKATVIVNEDLEVGGMLRLGTLDDLDSDPNPLELEDAYEIISFDKIPMIKRNDIFVRIVYLGNV